MYILKKKTSVAVMMLAVIMIFGSVAVYANPVLSSGTPLAPEGWTWDDDESDSLAERSNEPILSPVTPLAPEDWTWDDEPDSLAERPREHIMRLVIGQYAYTQNGINQVSDAAPFIVDDRTMIPLRLIAEAMGANVNWDGSTQTATITQGTTIITLVIGQPLPNDLGIPIIRNERTFVPLRFVAEALGADIEWDGATQSIEVIWVFQTFIEGRNLNDH